MGDGVSLDQAIAKRIHGLHAVSIAVNSALRAGIRFDFPLQASA